MIPFPAKGYARRKPCTENPFARFDEETEVEMPLFYSTKWLRCNLLNNCFLREVIFEIFRHCLPPSRPSLRFELSTSLRSCPPAGVCSPFGLAVCVAHDQRMRMENGECPSGRDARFLRLICFLGIGRSTLLSYRGKYILLYAFIT